MGRKIRQILTILLLIIFIGSTGTIFYVLHQYQVAVNLYRGLAEQYTVAAAVPETTADADHEPIYAPIQVDFEALQDENPDVVGWIYCEDSVINYPVMQGEDNDLYLHHSYDGEYSSSGSIFVDYRNAEKFADANSIIYGHHMKNGSMFASLDNWADQDYYESHSVMWLLTPNGDYRIDLVAGYTTAAESDTYTILTESGTDMTAYIDQALAQSDFKTLADVDYDAHYVLLSTCAYVFTNARYVLHGMLVPADSVGGVPMTD